MRSWSIIVFCGDTRRYILGGGLLPGLPSAVSVDNVKLTSKTAMEGFTLDSLVTWLTPVDPESFLDQCMSLYDLTRMIRTSEGDRMCQRLQHCHVLSLIRSWRGFTRASKITI